MKKKNNHIAIWVLILFLVLLTGISSAMNFGALERNKYSVFRRVDNLDNLENNLSGYEAVVAMEEADEEVIFVNCNETVYAHAGFALRSGPGVYYTSDRRLHYGQELTLTGMSEKGWARVELEGQEYYVHSACFSGNEPAPRTFVDSYGLMFDIVEEDAYAVLSYYVLSGPGTSYEVIDTLRLGERVHVLGTSYNNWNLIEIDGQLGYVYGDCITVTGTGAEFYFNDLKVTTVDATIYAQSSVSIRTAPDSMANDIYTLRTGDQVHLIGICENGYYLVQYDDYTVGYAIGSSFQLTEPINRNPVTDDEEDLEDGEETGEGEDDNDGNSTGSTGGGSTGGNGGSTGGGSTGGNGGGSTTPNTPSTPSTPTVNGPSGYQNPSEAQRLLDMVNNYRAQHGLGALSWSSSLESGAQVRAQEIAISGYFSHTRPNGSDFWTANDAIYAENIAGGQGSAEAVFDGWINSEGHRNNILNPDYHTMGVAMFVADGTTYTYYWTLELGY